MVCLYIEYGKINLVFVVKLVCGVLDLKGMVFVLGNNWNSWYSVLVLFFVCVRFIKFLIILVCVLGWNNIEFKYNGNNNSFICGFFLLKICIIYLFFGWMIILMCYICFSFKFIVFILCIERLFFSGSV